MKCIILLSLVALCYSYTYPVGTGYGSGYRYGTGLGSGYGYGRNIYVNQDGSITFTTPYTTTVVARGMGQNVAYITVTTPTGQYQIYSVTQPDTLAQILSQYQGNVNYNTYQQMLGDISLAVQNGQLTKVVYEVLLNFPVMQRQGVYGNQVSYYTNPLQQYLYQQVPMNQYPYSQNQIYGGMYTQKLQSVNYPSIYGVYGQQDVVGTGRPYYYNSVISSLLNRPNYVQYTQQIPVGQQPMTGQLSQVMQIEGQMLGQQNQIQQEQIQEQQEQQQLLSEQAQQLKQQQQMQYEQQNVQELQQQVQKEQQIVQQAQQQQYKTLGRTMGGVNMQQPAGVYPQGGLYGAYVQGNNVPLVV